MSRKVLIISFVFALTLGVFAPTIGHDFIVWDDDKNIYENELISSSSLEGIPRFWTASYQGLYIPVTYTAWSLLAYGSGTDISRGAGPVPVIAATRFHTANLLLHLASVALVILLLHRILGRRNLFAAAAGAALFAFHPLQVEAIAWATGLKDVLSGFLALLCIALYLRHARRADEAPRPRASLHYACALLVYIAALLAKPQLVVLPALIAILLFLDRGDTWRSAWKNRGPYLALLPFFAAALAALAVTLSVQPDQDAIFKFEVPPVWQRPIVALDALAFYLLKLVYPLGLSIDYGRGPAVAIDSAFHSPIWILPLLAGALLFFFREHRRLVLASALFILVAVLPNLGFIPFAYQGQSTVADRYVYLAMIGVGLFVAVLLNSARGIYPRCIAVVLLLAFAFVSARQTAFWKDTVTLLTHAIEVNPAAAGPTYNLAYCHSNDGEIDAALEYYHRVIEIKDDFANPRVNIGRILVNTRRQREAIPYLEKAIALDPRNAVAHLNLGAAHAGLGEHDKAIVLFQKALELDPRYDAAFINLGASWLQKENYPKALDYFGKAALLSPSLPQPHNGIGMTEMKLGNYESALRAFRNLLAVEPGQALNWRSLARAHAHLGNFPEASRAAARSLELARESPATTPALMDLLQRERANYLASRLE